MRTFGVRQHILLATLALILAVGIVFVVQISTRTEAAAGINKTVNFQGKMTDDQGLNVSDGNYQFVFGIYTVASGGSAVWTETVNLDVTDGIFQHNLGSSTPLPGSVDFDTDNIFLGITFNSDPDGEMTPRIQLTASPYAFNSDQLDGLDAGDFVQLSPSVAQAGSIDITGNINAASATFGGDLAVNGSTLVVDASSGFVGINTANPTAWLEIMTGSSAGGLQLTYTDASTSYADVSFKDDTSGNYKWSFGALADSYANTSEQNAFYVYQVTDKNEADVFEYRLFIADSGNVALGGTDPGYKLDVDGDINTSTGFRINGTSGSSITCSGGQFLQNQVVSGGITTGGSCAAGGGGTGDILNNGQNGAVTIGTNDANSLVLETNNQSALTIASGGATTFQNASNSSDGFRVNNSSGDAILRIDTANNRTAINLPSWISLDYSLQAQGYADDTQGIGMLYSNYLSGSTSMGQTGAHYVTSIGDPLSSNFNQYGSLSSQINTTATANTIDSRYAALQTSSYIDGAGSINELTGAFIDMGVTDAASAGIIRGIDTSLGNSGTGTVSSLSGINVRNAYNSGGGTISNQYGIRIENLTSGVNNYGLYIQGATSYALWVDSGETRLDGQLTIGESDTTGTLLVLDTKTDSGDPTGVDGAIYYNSSAGKFRCYQAGAWIDCIGSSSIPGVATVQDDFNDNSIDTGLWDTTTSGGGTITETGQQLEMSVLATHPSFTLLQTDNGYDLTDKHMQVELVSPGDTGNVYAGFDLYSNVSSGWIGFSVNSNTLHAFNSGGDLWTGTFNATTHSHLRIRESSGTTYWEVSSDGSTWSTVASETNSVDLTDVRPALWHETASSLGGPSTWTWDNFYLGTAASLAGGGSLFTDGGNFTYLTSTSDRLVVGGNGDTGAKLTVVNDDASQQVIGLVVADGQAGPVMGVYDTSASELLRLDARDQYSVFLGFNAGASDDGTDNNNIGIGHRALQSVTSSDGNIAIGGGALQNTTGGSNVAIGSGSMGSNTSGSFNISLGQFSNASNNGSENVIIGHRAMSNSTSTGNSVIIGNVAADNLTSGDNNILLGSYVAGNLTSGSNNIIIGHNLDASSSTASNELRIGGILQGDTSTLAAQFNGDLIVLGKISSPGSGTESQEFGLGANASGNYSVALGYNAASTADYTIAIGHSAAAGTSGGIAIGRLADAGLSDNIAIGLNANVDASGIAIGKDALSQGFFSVAVGNGASATNNYSTALGFGASSTHVASVALGYGATSVGDNQFVVGSDTAPITGVVFGGGVISANAASRDVVLGATSGFGTNIGGADMTIAGGTSTGNATGGSIILQTAAAGSSGTSFNPYTTRLSITGAGAITLNGTLDLTGLATGTGNGYLCRTTGGAVQYSASGVCTTSSQRYKHNIQTANWGLDAIRQMRPVTFNRNDSGREDFGFIAEEMYAINPLFTFMNDQGQVEGVHYMELTSVLTSGIQQLDIEVQNLHVATESAITRLAVLESSVATLSAASEDFATAGSVQTLTSTLTARIASLESGSFNGGITVAGPAMFNGTLTVMGDTFVQNITVSGKFITAGLAPAAAILGSYTASEASVVVTGNDTAGEVTFSALAAMTPAAGQQFTVNFSSPFSGKPRVNTTPLSAAAASAKYYIEPSANGFAVTFIDPPEAGKEYKFNYFVVQ